MVIRPQAAVLPTLGLEQFLQFQFGHQGRLCQGLLGRDGRHPWRSLLPQRRIQQVDALDLAQLVLEAFHGQRRPRRPRLAVQVLQQRHAQQAVERVHPDLAVGPVVQRTPAQPVPALQPPEHPLGVLLPVVGRRHLGRAPVQPVGHQRGPPEALRQQPVQRVAVDRDFETVSLSALYRAGDRLLRHRKALEGKLFSRAMGLFERQPTVTLVDLTNTYFEGEAKAQPKARRGRSKEKRNDCPLLTLGLVLDASGFVRRSEVLAGNVAESGTLAGMLQALQAPAEAVVVLDKGIATAENVAWLQQQGWRYVVASRERKREFDAEEALAVETASGTGVRIHKRTGEDGETRLYCESARRKHKEQAIVERAGERLEEELGTLHAGLSKPRSTKRLEKVWQRIGRLREKYPKASPHYRIELEADEQGQKAVAVKWERKPAGNSIATHPGVYCLRTNVADWDEQRLWSTYVLLTDLEAVFRSLKSELGLRPIYHSKPQRSEAHLFVTVLAYQLVQVIRTRLKQHQERASWTRLRRRLAGQQRVTAVFRRADGRTLHVRKATQAEPGQQAIYDALGVPSSPGGIRKMIV